MDNQNSNEVKVQEETPSVMRETLDKDGNVISPTNNFGPDVSDKTIKALEDFMDTENHKHKFSEEEVKKYKKNAMMCYLPFVSLYFILTNKIKKSIYLLFHANQGLIITIMWAVAFFISRAMNSIFNSRSMIADNSTSFVSFISYLLYCICFFTSLFGIINTVNDNSKEIPLVGKIKLLKGL